MVAQENGGVKPEEFKVADLVEKGFLDLYPELPYGRLVHVDDREGLPVLSFTYPDTWPGADAERTTPCEPYLEVIRSGLCECGYSREEATEYLQERVDKNC